MALELLILPDTKQAVASLNSNTPKQFASPTFGESIPIAVALVEPIVSPTGQRVFDPQSWAGWEGVEIAVGNGFVPPVAGTWYILSGIALTSGTITSGKRFKIVTYVSGDDFTNIGAASNATDVIFTSTGTTPTTWTHASELQEITGNIVYNPVASDVQSALNATAWITAAGGVVVSAEDTLYFFVTFNSAGARTQFVGNADNLAPLSIVECGTIVTGDSSLQDVQTVRIGQNAGAFSILTTTSPAAGLTVTENTAGGSGSNAKYTIALYPIPYDGTFSITIAGIESAQIPFNAPAVDGASTTGVQTYLENISIQSGALVTGRKYTIVAFNAGDDFANVGAVSNATGVVFVATGTTPTTWTHASILSPVAAGNVSVSQSETGTFFVVFQGALTNTDMGTITGDAGLLKVVPYLTGALNLDTPGIELMLGSAKSIPTFLVVTGIPPGQSIPQELMRLSITLNGAIVDPSTEIPQPRNFYFTSVESDARYGQLAQANSWGGVNAFTAGGGATFSSGSTLTVNGALAGTPTGGTFSLANVTLTMPTSAGVGGATLTFPELAKYGKQATNIASAGSIDLGGATGAFVKITGTTNVSALGTAAAGVVRTVVVVTGFSFIYNSTSLILPGAGDFAAITNDIVQFTSLGSGNWTMTKYLPASLAWPVATVAASAQGGITSSPGTFFSSGAWDVANATGAVTLDNFSITSDGSGNLTAVSFIGSGAVTADTGWTANADAGDKTKVIPAAASIGTTAAALDIVVPGAGTLLQQVAEKCKSLETALVASKIPNA